MRKEKQCGGKRTVLMAVIAAFVWMACALSVNLDAAAAQSIDIHWDLGNEPSTSPTKISLQVEAGQTFFVGDFLDGYNYDLCTGYIGMSGTKGLTFSVDKPSYLQLDKKTGYAKTLKQGKAVVTAKYKGKKYVCTFNIKKKGALKSTTTYGKINKLAAEITKLMEKKPTEKNMGQIAKKKMAYDKLMDPYLEKEKITSKGASSNGKDLLVPLAFHVEEAREMIFDYVDKTAFLNKLKIKRAKASCGSGKITLTLSKAVTEEQIILIQYMSKSSVGSSFEYAKTSSKKAYFTTRVECIMSEGDEDWSDSYVAGEYAAICQVEQGKKTVTVTLCNLDEDGEGDYTKKKKLIKGAEYEIGNDYGYGQMGYAWGKATKVVAK